MGISTGAALHGRLSFEASGSLLRFCESIEDFISFQRKQSISKIWNGVEGDRLNLVCFTFVALDRKVSME
jgi:hypothetical protein